jgi:hypothetical protein
MRQVASWASLFGLDVRRVLALRHLGRYAGDCWRYARRSDHHGFPLRLSALMPVLTDLDEQAGVADRHYFLQDLWAARKIFAARPRLHIDVGSRIDGFVAHLLTFMPVTVVDIRPLTSDVPGLTFIRGTCTDLSWIRAGSVPSVSSLHAVEHFGLGRYGDPVRVDAWRLAMRELARILERDGRLYLSVPVGIERVEFNAHRIFDPNTVLSTLSDLELISFAAVDEDGVLHERADASGFQHANYACGLFEFTKR